MKRRPATVLPVTNVMVTGPSSGIGKVTATALSRMGHHVVAAGRSRERIQPVIDAIEKDGGSAQFLELDLASFASVRVAASELIETNKPLDVLVNNAGVWRVKGKTADGFESHFGINHLGHFLLTQLLRPTFHPGTRIVNVSSAVHRRVHGIDFDSVTELTRSRSGVDEYGASKLANILFTSEMARRDPQWNTYAVHPGFVDTNIYPRSMRPFVKLRLISAEAGAATSIWCATDESLADESGGYYRELTRVPPSDAAQDADLAAELWERSEVWCGLAPQS